jgi:hypothetical protein
MGLKRGIQPAPPELLKLMQSERHERTIVFATEGSDELGLLDWFVANANCNGEGYKHIILREDPRLIEAWEEFLHGTQYKLGQLSALPEALLEAEVQVKRFMIDHARLMGITREDVDVLLALLGTSDDSPSEFDGDES